MINKWQKYVAIGVIVLVGILIVSKLVYNYQVRDIEWEEDDREVMISNCLDDLRGYAVRFPSQSVDYCNCTTDTTMSQFSKSEYLIATSGVDEDKEKELLRAISECYNTFQEAMFQSSKID